MSVFRGGPLPDLDHPGYVSGRHYPAFRGTIGTSGAVSAVDVLYGYLWRLRRPVTINALFVNVLTAGTTSNVKLGVWRVSSATGRPVGTPVASNNTGGATTSIAITSLAVSPSVTLAPGWYFWGSVHTGTTPVCASVAGSQAESVELLGAAANTAAIAQQATGGISTPLTYTDNIGTTNLAGATWTDVTLNPTRVPLLGFTVA